MNKRILIIDDDKEFCEELSEILKNEGFDIEYCLSSNQGIEMLKVKPYKLLLLDFKMSRINGAEFLKKYREELKELDIFIITGSLEINKLLLEENLSCLVTAVFNKPFDVQNLIRRIREVLC